MYIYLYEYNKTSKTYLRSSITHMRISDLTLLLLLNSYVIVHRAPITSFSDYVTHANFQLRHQ